MLAPVVMEMVSNLGAVIGLPPVLNYGSAELKARVIPEVFSGKKYISLAISEAFAGSDVAGLKTKAVKTEDGKYWIINGTKKWITNGTFSRLAASRWLVGCIDSGSDGGLASPSDAKRQTASPSFLSSAAMVSRPKPSRPAIHRRLALHTSHSKMSKCQSGTLFGPEGGGIFRYP